MSATANLFVMLLLAASPGDELAQPASGNVEKAVRPPHELRRAVHDALKRSAPASDPEPADTVPELIALFKELRTDTQIEQFDRKRLQGLVRARLEAMLKQLERGAPSPLSRRPQPPAVPQALSPPNTILAQQGLPPGNQPGPVAGNRANRGGRQGGVPDNGQMLVDLIKRTIAPTTWDDLGGPGTIYYYRPMRVLVVRQTGDVHEQLGGVLGGLRGK